MKLGEVIRKWRRTSDLNMRDAAREIGIGSSTLCRIEANEGMDGATLAIILRWLTTEVADAPKGKRAA